jgi:hypothetical protein
MRVRELKKSIASSLREIAGLRTLSGLIVLVFVAGCAPQRSSYPLASIEPQTLQCPFGYVRHCEVSVGNGFKKRYGQCYCSQVGW